LKADNYTDERKPNYKFNSIKRY